MEYFTHTPTYATGAGIARRIQEAMFGDGYRQAADDGPNPLVRTWQVAFRSIRSEQAAEIRAFLDRLGAQPFLWTPPAPDDIKIAVHVMGEYGHDFVKFDNENIGVTFVEDFNPADRCAEVQYEEVDGEFVLTTATAGATIRYSALDIDAPAGEILRETDGQPYVAPFTAFEDINYLAVAFHPERLPSKPAAWQFIA